MTRPTSGGRPGGRSLTPPRDIRYNPGMDTAIERDSNCFCCGVDNDKGLHLVFSYPGEGEAEASLRVPEYFSGWRRMTHGGFLSMLLDEAMAHACIAGAVSAGAAAASAVTAEMTVRFLKPVETGTQVRVAGKIVQTKGRIISTQGRIYDSDGMVAAEASARFLAAGPTS